MFRFGFRFIGFWFLAAALVTLVIDGTKSIADSAIVTTSVADYFLQFSPTTLQKLEFGVQNNLGSPWLWDVVFVTLLGWPAFLVLGLIGTLLALVGRRRNLCGRRSGYAVPGELGISPTPNDQIERGGPCHRRSFRSG